jgi:ubiquinone/menaquinone biosynthesis C-methylase UbiE
MLYTRYKTAAAFCEGKAVLEVACSSGQGLGYLAKRARRVVGGDYTAQVLQLARCHYGGNIPLLRLDAHALPFPARSFDVVILYEAIYYLSRPEQFLEECCRILRDGSVLLICTVNKEWADFNPSPFSTRYFSAKELSDLLQKHQFQVELYGAFPVAKGSTKDAVVSFIKRTAMALHLMPNTMKGKESLKRIFFGKLVPLPPEVVDGMADYAPPVPLSSDSQDSQYKVLYAVAHAR